jgi:hypothetical protein
MALPSGLSRLSSFLDFRGTNLGIVAKKKAHNVRVSAVRQGGAVTYILSCQGAQPCFQERRSSAS